MKPCKRVLVLGGYGLIGATVARTLHNRGHSVTVAGRDGAAARHVMPGYLFVYCDLNRMTNPEDWATILRDVDVVVNCAGALQETKSDSLRNIHVGAIAALAAAALDARVLIVQISAAGVSKSASTAFLRTKAEGDDVLMRSGADHVVLRPGLVLAQGAYGGTGLIRMLAALPWVQPVALGQSQIRTVSVLDIAKAVEMAVRGDLPNRFVADLVEPKAHSLMDVVSAHREALGFAPAKVIELPNWCVVVAARGSDFLALLGWRSPLRSTAVAVLRDGIEGDPEHWASYAEPLSGMQNSLRELGLGTEHRLQARMALLKPLIVACLSLFWIISGVLGGIFLTDAAGHLTNLGWSASVAKASVMFWSIVDIALGAGILFRKYAARICALMAAVCVVYAAAALVVTPGLWLDPLGPLVKIVPALVLALVGWALLMER